MNIQNLVKIIKNSDSRIYDDSKIRFKYGQISQAYSELNFLPGTPILILTNNRFEFIQHWIAIVEHGFVPIPISPSTRSSKIKELINTFKVGGLLSSYLNINLFKEIYLSSTNIGSYTLISFDQKEIMTNPGEIMIMTSGTSGGNTACVHSISSVIKNAEMHNKALGINSTDRQLVILPMYYSFAMIAQTIGALISGCELIIDGPPFTVERFSNLIDEQKISVAAITPTLVRNILNSNINMKKIRVLSVGGDQLESNDVKRLFELGLSKELYLTYGLTEAGPRVATLSVHLADQEDYDSIGYPLDEIKVKIDNADSNNIGELLISSPTVMLRKIGINGSQQIEKENFLSTGDIFQITNKGLLKFKGRMRDFVIHKGEKVNLKSINQLVERYPNILYAKTSLDIQEELQLEIHLRNKNDTFDNNNLIKYLKSNLQSFEVPKKITISDLIDFKK